jgi:nicotinamide mononucleotide transporter
VKLFEINETFITILGYPLSYVEFIATFFGLFSIWLATKQVILTWSTGLINIVFSFMIFYQVQLYSDMFLQIYFFITNIYGWVIWKKHFQGNRPVTALSRKTRVLLLILILISTVVFGLLVKNIHLIFPKVFIHPASFPFIDTLIAVTSIIGTILLAKRIIDNWALWLIIDMICVVVYALKNIIFISIEYAVFCILACLGLFSWRKSIRTEKVSYQMNTSAITSI